MKTKNSIAAIISAAYVGVSIVVFIGSQVSGTLSSWLIQSLMGPVWHLSALISVCKTPFNYLDGVFRFSGEDLLMAVMSLCIWLSGGLLLTFSAHTESKRKRIISLIGLLFLWIIVGFLNILLYGVFSL